MTINDNGELFDGEFWPDYIQREVPSRTSPVGWHLRDIYAEIAKLRRELKQYRNQTVDVAFSDQSSYLKDRVFVRVRDCREFDRYDLIEVPSITVEEAYKRTRQSALELSDASSSMQEREREAMKKAVS